MNKISALFNLLRQGGEVTNAAAWKNRTIVFNLLVAILGVATAFGYKLGIDADTLTNLAGGIVAAVAVVGSVVHVVTDARVGLPSDAGTDAETKRGDGAKSAPADIRDPGGA